MSIYNTTRKVVLHKHINIYRDKPKVMTCLHDTRNTSMMINHIEVLVDLKTCNLPLHQVPHGIVGELFYDHGASQGQGNFLPFQNHNRSHQDQIMISFKTYEQLSNMHEDIQNIVESKKLKHDHNPFPQMHVCR